MTPKHPKHPKRRNPKKDKTARRKRPPRSGTFTDGFLGPAPHDRAAGMSNADDAPPESMLPVLLTTVWAGMQSGDRANNCIGGCRTIGYALGELGIPTELRSTRVVVYNRVNERTTERAPLIPSWTGSGTLRGHCVLTMPTLGRWADPTIEQFPGFSAHRGGPAVGRFGPMVDPATGRPFTEGDFHGRPPEGTQVAVPRGELLALYTFSPDAANAVITRHPSVSVVENEYRKAGVKLASLVLAHVGKSDHMVAQLRAADFPRAHALLDAIGGLEYRAGESGVWFPVSGDGATREMLLNEIPLPAGTPPPCKPL